MCQRTVRLDDNVAFLQPLYDVPTVTPRVDLVLSNINLAAPRAGDVFLEFIEMVDSVVRHSNRADFSFLLCLDQGLPRPESLFFSAVGCVKKDSYLSLVFWQAPQNRRRRDTNKSIYSSPVSRTDTSTCRFVRS